MKPRITNSVDFKPNLSHKFFFDSNVWLYLLFPQYSGVSNKIIQKYSDLFERILNKDLLIETTLLQISELVNLIQRIEFKQYCQSKGLNTLVFKEYIKTTDGEKSIKNAQLLVNLILKSSSIRAGNLTEAEMLSIMSEIEKADFNDMCFARHCEKENSVLVTHDFDFHALNQKIDIVSANENYLS